MKPDVHLMTTKDRFGARVEVGTRVRVLKISESVFGRLLDDEAARVRSMEGEIFEVYEADRWGAAWVEKWWHPASDESLSHSLGLQTGVES